MALPLSAYKDLRDARARRQAGLFLVEGPRATSLILERSTEHVAEILLEADTPDPSHGRVPIRRLTARQFAPLAPSKTPQGTLSVVRIPPGSFDDRLPRMSGGDVVVLEHVQDPGNVGTVIRSAAAFGFAGVVLSSQCADPFSPKCVQASAGALLSLWTRRTTAYLELIADARMSGWRVAAAALDGDSGRGWLTRAPAVLALGNEGRG